MSPSLRSIMLAGASAAVLATSIGPAGAGAPPPAKRIEVAFVLDTTGSMSGLIEGAKRKIWSVANSIVDINPNADIRMALIGYRDIGDEYVVRLHDMSADIQGLYGDLTKFQADGGGDGPESVNEALETAVEDVQWTSRDDTRRIVFLVGDAPPHMDYRGAQYPEIIRQARQNGIIVNTIQAGEDPETREFWQEMARLGDGSYFALPQDGGQVHVYSSPYDDQIIELQRRIDKTAVPYGNRADQEKLRGKIATRAAAPAEVQVDNSGFYSKKAAKELVTGGGDLLDDVRNNVKSLDTVPAAELPDEMKTLSKDELKAAVEERTKARSALEGEMAALVKKRDVHVADEMKKRPAEPDSFDRQIMQGISGRF